MPAQRPEATFETHNASTASPDLRLETRNTSAAENWTKNTHFSPAKAMAVSTPHRHKRAKATGVSNNRATWSAGPGSGTRGQYPLQTSSNRSNLKRLPRTSVTNVVNLRPKTTIFSEKAVGLTTFVTTDQKSTRKTPPIDDVCNNTQEIGQQSQRARRLRCRWAAAPGRASRRHAKPISTPGTTGVEGARRTCHGAGGRRRGLARLRDDAPHISTPGTTGVGGAGGSCRGAGGRRRGLAGLRDDAPNLSAHQEPLVWRAPEGPEGTGGLRGAAPNEVRSPSLAGGRGLRRPEHPWGHKHTTTKRGRDRFPGRGLAALNQRYSAEQAPAIRRSCPRDPRPRRGQPRGGQRGRGTGSRTRSRRPRCGRSGSTAGRHRARHTRRA